MKTYQIFILLLGMLLPTFACEQMEENRETNQKTLDRHYLGTIDKDKAGIWDSGILKYLNDTTLKDPLSMKGTIWEITYVKANGFNIPILQPITIEIISDNIYGLNAIYNSPADNISNQRVQMFCVNAGLNMGQKQLHLNYFPILTGSSFYTTKVSQDFMDGNIQTDAIVQQKIAPFGQTGQVYYVSMHRIK